MPVVVIIVGVQSVFSVRHTMFLPFPHLLLLNLRKGKVNFYYESGAAAFNCMLNNDLYRKQSEPVFRKSHNRYKY